MRYLDLRLREPDWMLHPMQEFIREGGAVEYEELRAWNLLPGEEVEYELFYVVGDLEPYREAIDGVDSVRWYELTPVDEGSFYCYICQETLEADRAFRAAFATLELVVVPPIVYDADADLRMTLVGEGENLQAVVDRFPEDVEATVRAIGEFDRHHGTLAGSLTDRQFEAVRTAARLGYYRTPREADVRDVAAALGCAPSTASDHLQKAEGAVMERIVSRTTPPE